MPHRRLERVDGVTLEKQVQLDLNHIPMIFGDRYASFHRVDLHNELRRLAVAEEGEGPPAKIHLRSPVSKVDATSGSITLEDGSVHLADLIVGADGLHSVVRKAVLEEDFPARDTKMSAFRFLLDTDKMMADPTVAELLSAKRETVSLLFDGTDASQQRLLVWYECRRSVESDHRVSLFRWPWHY